jgi:hypothetical protein
MNEDSLYSKGIILSLVAGPVNKQLLINLTHEHTPNCSEVVSAIAYASENNLALFEVCKQYGKSLTFYGRYDESVPVEPGVVGWFLEKASPNYVCRMVPDILHAKVIWWVDVGAYIGSANLTDRAWNSNIEAGVYLNQDALEDSGMLEELRRFFSVVEERSQPISKEFHKHLLALTAQRAGIAKAEAEFRKMAKRFFPPARGITEVETRRASQEKGYIRFEKAWRESLQALRDIASLVVRDEYRPFWIPSETPAGAQADQFIHAYYYRYIKGHRGSSIVDAAHSKNRVNREQALKEALEWWRAADFDYSEEKRHLLQWARQLQAALSRERLHMLSMEEFIGALSKVHAIRAYGGKRRNADLGIETETAKLEDKLIPHLTEIWNARSKQGKTVVEILEHVIWGNGPIERRIWDGVESETWSIPGLGFSALGEIVGWARPNDYPPRNDRSIKGLRALGQEVRSV